MFLLFVYGTLKKGYENHRFLERSRFVAHVKTKDRYPMIDFEGLYPYMIEDIGIGFQIDGELYEIDSHTLKCIDILEEVPNDYYRKEILVMDENAQEHSALCYFSTQAREYKITALLSFF